MKKKELILLVEDDIFVKDIYNHKLTLEGYDVLMAENGIEAIDFLKKHTPDLILLDIMIPYMDGREVLRKVKENEEWQKIPIIMLTNLSESEDIEESEILGADKYLIKSHFSPSEVAAKIREVLDLRKSKSVNE